MDKKEVMAFDPEKINLFDIKIENSIQINHDFDASECDMVVGFDAAIEQNISEGNLRVLFNVNLKRKDGVSDFAEFYFQFYFNVQNIKDFYTTIEDEPILSSQMAVPLVSIAISTARGIIFEKLQESKWKKIIIPVISPSKVLRAPSK